MGTSWPRYFVVGVIACGLALLPASAAADQDLRSLLADAPSSSWVEADPTPTVMDGPFTAQSYADYLQAVGVNTPTQAANNVSYLNRYGFVAGYARSWEERGSQDLLVERVFAFQAGSGADFWYADIKLDSQTSTEFAGDLSGIGAIPNSFGVVLKSKDSTDREFRVDFKTANYVFIVHADSYTNDLSSLAVAQATREYSMATEHASPAPSSTPVGGSPSAQATSRIVNTAIGATIALLVVALAIGGTLYVLGRRRKAAPQVQMSPDWAYWWDGLQWQPAATTTPPHAPRSPDGVYWWDGRTWRPVSVPVGRP